MRRNFERENKNNESHLSFKNANLKANVAFEISSEGELEQIKPLIRKCIEEKKIIELIFCSDSVTHQCEKIFQESPESIRLYRLPLITYFPFIKSRSLRAWKTSPVTVLCRYDFFPELILKSSKEKLILVWGSLKSFSKKSPLEKFFLKQVYNTFEAIFCATENDKLLFESLTDKENIFVQDFRPFEILQRLKSKEEKIKKIFKNSYEAINFFNWVSSEGADVLGSYWPSDFEILKAYSELDQRIIFIAPHVLESSSIQDLKNGLLSLKANVSVVEITKDSLEEFSEIKKKSQTSTVFIIMNLKGFLCELYSYTKRAYVSGGFGRSVHSLLEPAVSGNQIICGPRIFRSTEYDIVKEVFPNAIAICDSEGEVVESFRELEVLSSEKVVAWHKNIIIMNEKAFIHFFNLLESFHA